MRLEEIVPWGRSMEEYQLMFRLEEEDLGKRILGCGDGPASFNAEMTALGRSVASCDPIYAFTADQIADAFERNLPRILSQVKSHPEDYVWGYHKSPEQLCANRRRVLNQFLMDFPAGLREGRYIEASLPSLPFADGQFDLALCSHLLFLYSNLLSARFHVDSIKELCRVAKEVRVFPLTDLTCELSPHLAEVRKVLAAEGCEFQTSRASYQLQRNGTEYLRIRRA